MYEYLCRICGTLCRQGIRKMECRTSDGTPVAYSICDACGSMQLDPSPSEESIHSFYQRDYYGCGGSKFVSGVDTLRNRFIALRARKVLAACPARNPKVLDVGCGSGTFLQCMGRYGAQMYGTELAGPACDRARLISGAKIEVREVTDSLFPGTDFDIITIWHVLEHTKDPASVLAACARRLTAEGRLFVEVPRIESLQGKLFGSNWLHLDPPRHLYQFTDKGMRSMLNRAGLHAESIETRAFEMSAMGALQSMLNRHIATRDLFYNMLSTRNRCPGPFKDKLMSVLLAGLLAFPVAFYAAIEMITGHGVILRYRCRNDIRAKPKSSSNTGEPHFSHPSSPPSSVLCLPFDLSYEALA